MCVLYFKKLLATVGLGRVFNVREFTVQDVTSIAAHYSFETVMGFYNFNKLLKLQQTFESFQSCSDCDRFLFHGNAARTALQTVPYAPAHCTAAAAPWAPTSHGMGQQRQQTGGRTGQFGLDALTYV